MRVLPMLNKLEQILIIISIERDQGKQLLLEKDKSWLGHSGIFEECTFKLCLCVFVLDSSGINLSLAI